MAARASMATLIARVRQMINDTSGSPTFQDQEIQDVLDQSRMDIYNTPLKSEPTFSGIDIQYLNYFSDVGGWEDDYVLKQYLTTLVTPSSAEPIAGRFAFAQNVFPPVYITGKIYDVFRAAADLLDRMAAKHVLCYSFSSDGQSFQRGTVPTALQALARTYRMQQRPRAITMRRSDIASGPTDVSLKATELDRMASGNGS